MNTKRYNVLGEWRTIRSIVKTKDKEKDFETAINIFMNNENTTEDKKNKYASTKDFERIPTVIRILSFDRVKGKSKFLDKFGFSNVLTFSINGIEKTFDSSSWTFAKAYKESGCKSGDDAMICTIGYTDEKTGRQYRYWIIQKLGEPIKGSVHMGGLPELPV